MKLKMLTRMAAMVAAGSLVVGLLAGCSVIPSKDGAADSAVATDTALILTQGDGMPALTNAEEFLNSVIVTPGGSAGLVVADGKPFALGPQRFDQVKSNDIQQARADKTARYQLVEAVQGAAATTPETDLISAISLASRMLSAGTADNKVLIIRHSGVNTAVASLPMQDLDLLNSDPAKLLDQLDAAAMLPQLNGVAVEFYGLGDVAGSQGTLSAQQVQWLKSFWQAFFDRTGANVTFHTDIVSGDALNNGHTVTPLAAAGAPTFVKVSAEQVAFQPDSTTFLDEAAARAALNGLAEQLKGTSAAHYIVAGSTAQVDNASREGAQALSLARAQALPTDSPAWGWATSRRACAAQMSRRTAAPTSWLIPRPRLRSFWQWVRLRADRQISRAPRHRAICAGVLFCMRRWRCASRFGPCGKGVRTGPHRQFAKKHFHFGGKHAILYDRIGGMNSSGAARRLRDGQFCRFNPHPARGRKK